MSKWKDLNISLRSVILSHSLRLEQTSSHIIKVLLRILKDKTKTLSNKSSSLSFKNKIDLMHDLDELTDIEYNHLLKFMEIRNQFIHNHEFSSFINLKEFYPEYTSYIKKHFPNENSNEEQSFYESYKKLYIACLVKLLILESEYLSGIKTDYEKFIALEIDKRFDELLDKSRKNMEKANSKLPFNPLFFGESDSNIDNFILALKIEKATMSNEIIGNLETEGKEYLAFKRRMTIDEQLKEIPDDNESKLNKK